LWFWAPIAAGGLLSALVLALLFVPRLGGLIRDTQRLQGLEAMRDEVSLLRNQMGALDQQEEKTKTLNARLLNLISGSGDLSTFLAKLDQEARGSGVQLDLYEPQVVAPPRIVSRAAGQLVALCQSILGNSSPAAPSAVGLGL
jgi:type IV pilus assembly protein PilO